MTSGGAVLLAGPRGVRRAAGGGEFSLVGGPARSAAVDQFDRAGSAVFAYGATAIVRTTNGGSSWKAIKGPKSQARAAAARRRHDLGLERLRARQFRPRVAHRQRWPALDRARGRRHRRRARARVRLTRLGYLTLRQYPADGDVAYVLRTTDSGRHWRPQRIASGGFPGTEGVISPSASRSYALTSTPAAGGDVFRSLFTTATGGDAGPRPRCR